MKAKIRLYLLVSMIAVSIVGLSACGPTVPPTPQPTATITPTPVPEVSTYVIDPKLSVVRYEATGPFNLKLPGTFDVQSGNVQFKPEGDGVRMTFELVINGGAVSGVNDVIVNALRSNLEVDKYPTGRFAGQAQEVIKLSSDAVTVTATGTLTLHGQTQPLSLPLLVSLNGDTLKVSGKTVVDLFDYKVNVPTALMSNKATFEANVIAKTTLSDADATAEATMESTTESNIASTAAATASTP